jgi:hypothetical protein
MHCVELFCIALSDIELRKELLPKIFHFESENNGHRSRHPSVLLFNQGIISNISPVWSLSVARHTSAGESQTDRDGNDCVCEHVIICFRYLLAIHYLNSVVRILMIILLLLLLL